MTDFRAYARETALRAGLDPDIFERQIQQESGFNPAAFNVGSGATGIAQIVPAMHPGVDPGDPIASLDYAASWLADLKRQFGSYAKALAAYNWGPGNVGGYTREDGRVVPPWDGRRETLPPETQQYLDIILSPNWTEPDGRGSVPAFTGATYRLTEGGVRLRQGPGTGQPILVADLGRGTIVEALDDALVAADGHQWRHVRLSNGTVGYVAADFLARQEDGVRPGQFVFNPDTPTELQLQDWTCSIRSTMWMLKSIGIAITPEEAQDGMCPRFVSQELGLLEASGAGIVQFLREAYGVEARNQDMISFDEAAALAGLQPLALGGRNWGGPSLGHWSAVRGVSAGQLVLANPAGTGPQFGQQMLDRVQFDGMGPFSAVWIPV